MKKLFLFFSVIFCGQICSAQEEDCNCPGQHKKSKGTFYGSWGYNKDYFSRSDLHFSNNGSDNYDFTLYDVKAKDRPGFDQIIDIQISIPQYVYRFGYYFDTKKGLGIELNFDHTKYVMVQGQTVRIKGQIHETALDQDTVLSRDFLRFEHTNGANFMMINFLKRHTFLHSKNNRHWLSGVLKTGGGIVIPKSDVAIFGKELDNIFHVSGWIAGVETGMRYDRKYFFLEQTVKGSFANYLDVLTVGTGKANHRFWCFEIILTAGFQFGW